MIKITNENRYDIVIHHKFECDLCKNEIEFTGKENNKKLYHSNCVSCNHCNIIYDYRLLFNFKIELAHNQDHIYTCVTRFLRKYNRRVLI